MFQDSARCGDASFVFEAAEVERKSGFSVGQRRYDLLQAAKDPALKKKATNPNFELHGTRLDCPSVSAEIQIS